MHVSLGRGWSDQQAAARRRALAPALADQHSGGWRHARTAQHQHHAAQGHLALPPWYCIWMRVVATCRL